VYENDGTHTNPSRANNLPEHSKTMVQLSIAVIGAGLSGLTCAKQLLTHGNGKLLVTVFEKHDYVGGRMSSSEVNQCQSEIRKCFQFDEGAQYLTAFGEPFRKQIDEWKQIGLVTEWHEKICVLDNNGQILKENSQENCKHFVGVQGMEMVERHLAKGIQIRHCCKIVQLMHEEDLGHSCWRLKANTGEVWGDFDLVILTAPAPVTASLLESYDPQFAQKAYQTKTEPCWSVFLGFWKPLRLPFDAAFVENSPLVRIAKNSSKPGRDINAECWVLDASSEWSKKNANRTEEEVANELRCEFLRVTKLGEQNHIDNEPTILRARMWKHAHIQPLNSSHYFNVEKGLAACGDWFSNQTENTSQLENAFLSAISLSDAIIKSYLKNETGESVPSRS